MNALAACCHFSIFIGSFLYQRAKPPQGIVIFINLLGKALTPRACMGDAGSIWWAPDRNILTFKPDLTPRYSYDYMLLDYTEKFFRLTVYTKGRTIYKSHMMLKITRLRNFRTFMLCSPTARSVLEKTRVTALSWVPCSTQRAEIFSLTSELGRLMTFLFISKARRSYFIS